MCDYCVQLLYVMCDYYMYCVLLMYILCVIIVCVVCDYCLLVWELQMALQDVESLPSRASFYTTFQKDCGVG